MNDKRIASYMTVTALCAAVCCAAAAYLIFENIVHRGTAYEDLLRVVISVSMAIVLFRHFVVRYRLQIQAKPLWIKLPACFLYPVLLAVMLTAFSALCTYTYVNDSFWDNPIPYTVFLRKELGLWRDHTQNWIVPAVLLAGEGLYVFAHQSKFGKREILPAASLFFTSPFREQETEPWDCDTEENETAVKKVTTILQFVRDKNADGTSVGRDDGQKE